MCGPRETKRPTPTASLGSFGLCVMSLDQSGRWAGTRRKTMCAIQPTGRIYPTELSMQVGAETDLTLRDSGLFIGCGFKLPAAVMLRYSCKGTRFGG